MALASVGHWFDGRAENSYRSHAHRHGTLDPLYHVQRIVKLVVCVFVWGYVRLIFVLSSRAAAVGPRFFLSEVVSLRCLQIHLRSVCGKLRSLDVSSDSVILVEW